MITSLIVTTGCHQISLINISTRHRHIHRTASSNTFQFKSSMLILYPAVQLSLCSSCSMNTRSKSESVLVCHPLPSGSDGSLGWSRRGRLQRQPSWKWWYRPGAVRFFVCGRSVCFGISPSSPISFSFSSRWDPLPPPVSVAPLLLSHANSLICQRGKKSGEEKNTEANLQLKKVPPPPTPIPPPPPHTPPPPLTPSSRYPPQLI